MTILLVAALLNLEGSYIHPTASINVSSTPNFGRYLFTDVPVSVNCILQTAAFTFDVVHPNNPKSGDLELKVKMQSFSTNLSENPEDKDSVLPIWIFWYKPSHLILESLAKDRQRVNICLYLYENPSKINDMTANNSQIKVWKLPDKNLEEGMAFLSNQICKAFGGWLT